MDEKFMRIGIPVYEDAFDYAGEVLENIQRKQFSLKDAGITSRVHNNWRNLGIVPDTEEDGKKLYFDFIQYLWLQIVKDLRKFGLPLEVIAAVRDYLFDTDIEENRAWSDSEREALREAMEKEAQRPVTDEEFEQIEGLISLRRLLYPYRFSAIVLAHFQKRSNTNIYIFSDGGVAVWSDVEQEYSQEEKIDLSEPHINIPLGHYFAQFLNDETKAEFLPKIPLLTREEHEVLRAMRNDEVKELIVKFSKTGNKRRADLITKVDKQLTDKQKKEIARILGNRDYSTITMKKQNGTQLTFEEAQRTRL